MKNSAVVNDKRKISGNRVIAKCELNLYVIDPYSSLNKTKMGYFVLNARGGCLYLSEHIHKRNLHNIFPDGEVTKIKRLVLSRELKPDIIIDDLNIMFLRLIKQTNREGIVFRFVDITEAQMDLIYTAQSELPTINSNEETSVHFDEVISLDRHNFHQDCKLELVCT